MIGNIGCGKVSITRERGGAPAESAAGRLEWRGVGAATSCRIVHRFELSKKIWF